jgi:DNA polymerase-1
MAKTFQKLASTDPRTVMILDSLNLAFRWKHSGETDFLESYIKTVESLKKSYNCGKVIIACDKGSSSYRKSIYEDYKQNRKDKQALSTPEEQAAFERFFEEFMRVIDNFAETTNYPVFRFDKVEADDIAAYIVKNRKDFNIDNIVLISSDRDWDLLVAPDVMRFSYVTRKEVTWDNYSEHYEWTPEQYISIKCLQGDPGDNVPGVPGVGPKKAMALVQQYETTYDIIASLPINSKYKYIQNLNEFGADRLILNYKLMDLLEFCEEAVGVDNINTINNTLREYLNES